MQCIGRSLGIAHHVIGLDRQHHTAQQQRSDGQAFRHLE
jgi:hypothetical protein